MRANNLERDREIEKREIEIILDIKRDQDASLDLFFISLTLEGAANSPSEATLNLSKRSDSRRRSRLSTLILSKRRRSDSIRSPCIFCESHILTATTHVYCVSRCWLTCAPASLFPTAPLHLSILQPQF